MLWTIVLALFSAVAAYGTPKVDPDVLGFGRLRFINVTIPTACSSAGQFSLFVELDRDSQIFEACLFPIKIQDWIFVPYNSTSIVSVPDLDLSKGSKADLKISRLKFTGKIFGNKDLTVPMEFFTPNRTDFVPTNTSYFKLKLSCPSNYKEIIFNNTSGSQLLAPTVKITNAANSHIPTFMSAVALAYSIIRIAL
ncbi:hypothetical protein DSO57_1029982 [Entomophthora muscae]|uniref:Uncharacterized protein n=1 Tax=Entomophthora muscae TaxID=34485 RepID=A0ACC2UA27_9FUNG|nr:hypothetical protein DSO57_1029982 [Entomophthora muscae]